MQIEKSSLQTDGGSPDTFTVKDQLLQSFRSAKEYRHAFVEEALRSSLAAQIKSMRESMPDMTQKRFGELLGNKSQSWVARLEDPNEAPPTLSTLLSVAEACDVALVVRFAPFSEFLDWVGGVPHWGPGLSPETLAVPDFDHDPGLIERKASIAEGELNTGPGATKGLSASPFGLKVATMMDANWQSPKASETPEKFAGSMKPSPRIGLDTQLSPGRAA